MNNKQLSALKRIIYRPSEPASSPHALLYRSRHLKRFLLFFMTPSFHRFTRHLHRVGAEAAWIPVLTRASTSRLNRRRGSERRGTRGAPERDFSAPKYCQLTSCRRLMVMCLNF